MRLSIRVPHGLETDEVRQRLETRVTEFDRRYPRFRLRDHYRWIDTDRAVAEYRGGRGSLQLGRGELAMDVELPFFARLYRSRIEAFIERELASVLTDVSSRDAASR